jgi:hypothetical protein
MTHGLLTVGKNNAEIPEPRSQAIQTWKRVALGHPAYWVCQVAGWLGAATGEIIVSFLHSERSATEVSFTLFGASLGILISHGLRALVWWQNWFVWSSRKQLLGSVLVCLPAAALYVFFFFPLVWRLDPYQLQPAQQLAVGLATFFWTYSALLVWCGLYFGWHYLLKLQQAALDRVRLDAALKEAELRALRAQLNPHFLFNALNSVRALVERDPPGARRAVTILANLLRSSLYSSEHETVPFARELESVKDYLALEHIRFEDRLRVVYEIDPEACNTDVPALGVQILVENAVKHGISSRIEGGLISIAARVTGNWLVVRVTNSPGKLVPHIESGGMGLKNLAERLRLLFGAEASVTVRQTRPEVVTAELRLRLKDEG